MKKIFIYKLAIVFVGLLIPANAQWIEQNNPIPNSTIRDIFALNENTAIAIGVEYFTGEGILIKTTDGGASWFSIPHDTSIGLSSVYFLDDSVGWIAGGKYFEWKDTAVILKTTDEGNNWEQNIVGTGWLNSVQFVDQNIGWTSGYDSNDWSWWGVMYMTTDGGSNWVDQNSAFIANDFIFINQDTGWVVTGTNLWLELATISKTTDGGSNWNMQIVDSISLRSILFIDDNKGWAAGSKTGLSMVYKTINGGETWTSSHYW